MSKQISFIDLSGQQKRLRKKINGNISNVLSHGKYIMGPEVIELEEKLSKYTGAKYSISCASGTDALLLALMAADIGTDDIVFCPAFTFPATAEVISLLGAIPYFVDVEKDTFNISAKCLKNTIKTLSKEDLKKVKAIIAVDLYGLPANYNEINKIAKENKIVVIADAAQSFGAEYYGKKVGNHADITCVSFFPAKPLGCYGDGGMLFTENEGIADKVKSLRVHGKGKSKYDIDLVGLNSRLDTIQAAILLAKFEEFDWEVKSRNIIAKKYSEELEGIIDIPFIPDNIKSIWAQYTLKHEDRKTIQDQLNLKGIPTMVYYPKPMHLQNAYKKYYRRPMKNAEKLCEQVFSIPIYPDMTLNDQKYIIDNLRKII